MYNQPTLQRRSSMEVLSHKDMTIDISLLRLKTKNQEALNQNAFNKGVDLAMIQTEAIKLNFEEIKCFEILENQFAHLGLTCSNAIAIQASNPAFPEGKGASIIKQTINRCLEFNFSKPINFFSCYITSSRKTILSAYDNRGNLLTRSELSQSNLVGSNSPIPANAPLGVQARNIARITIDAFDGQLTLTELSFTF